MTRKKTRSRLVAIVQKWPLRGIVAGLLLLGGIACTPKTSPSEATPPAESSTAAEPEPEAPSQTTQANLQTYDETANGIPVTAQYPDTMEVVSSGSGEGIGVFFTPKLQGNALDEAQVHVFLPAGASSSDDLMPMITGPHGLIETNGWTLNGSRSDGVTEFPYPWFERVFDFSTDQEQSGHILIGQTAGQAVQVILLYPAEMADAYWPAAKTILDSLAFEPSLLPVETSPEGGSPAAGEFQGEDPATMCDPAKEPC